MESRSNLLARNLSRAAAADEHGGISPGDQISRPVGVVDIGSNSVRLVVYDRLSRSPTPIFNEKVLCGLGKQVAVTGELPREAVVQALAALARYRAVADIMHVGDLHVIATAAARAASNGPDFVARATEILRVPAMVISGGEEARLAALGVVSAVHRPDGLVADMGGGSLELVDIKGQTISEGVSLPLGGLALRDSSGRSLKRAAKAAEDALAGAAPLARGQGRDLYAIGGTWRALARLHMREIGYPLNVLHGYTVAAAEMVEFCRMLQRVEIDSLAAVREIPPERRPLLAFGAVVMEQVLKVSRSRRVVTSAAGVREGLLLTLLSEEDRKADPLLVAASELNRVRSRSPTHALELVSWTDRFMKSAGVPETSEERRLRRVACLLGDMSWRAHPDYRGEQSLHVIAHAALPAIDHGERAFLALAAYYRHEGNGEAAPHLALREFMSVRAVERARLVGLLLRAGFSISAAMPGILPRAPLTKIDRRLVLSLTPAHAPLANDRLMARIKAVARILGLEVAATIV